jgi:glucokinase
MAQGFPRLLGDVGGTNARWAWQPRPGAALERMHVLPCSKFGAIDACIEAYLRLESLPPPRSAAFGIATAITGDQVQMTNHAWRFSIAALRERLGVDRLLVLNDFEALAHALPALSEGDSRAVGAGVATADANKAVIGAGTGLGMAGLVADGRGGWQPVVGEGGHATLAASTPREASLLAVLRERFGHASAERALSGPGLVNLYEALCVLDAAPPAALEPADVLTLAVARGDAHDPRCGEALQHFAALLGSAAGNLALTLGARGGIYIGGGIAPRLGSHFDALPFRARFEDKGRFRSYLEAIPTRVIVAEAPALLGAALALDRRP